MVAADALVPNRHLAISNHHGVNIDSSQDFIGNLSVKIPGNLNYHIFARRISKSLWLFISNGQNTTDFLSFI